MGPMRAEDTTSAMVDRKAICSPLSAHVIFARYVFFATVAGLANIMAQEIIIRTVLSEPIEVSILVGTVTGFLVKYLLDKRWVFLDVYEGRGAEIRKILVYGAFGVATTLLFWGIELSFWRVGRTAAAKYLGAVLGLSLGNWIKYLLDKHYVFPRN
jgi:putative flippase GtrA